MARQKAPNSLELIALYDKIGNQERIIQWVASRGRCQRLAHLKCQNWIRLLSGLRINEMSQHSSWPCGSTLIIYFTLAFHFGWVLVAISWCRPLSLALISWKSGALILSFDNLAAITVQTKDFNHKCWWYRHYRGLFALRMRQLVHSRGDEYIWFIFGHKRSVVVHSINRKQKSWINWKPWNLWENNTKSSRITLVSFGCRYRCCCAVFRRTTRATSTCILVIGARTMINTMPKQHSAFTSDQIINCEYLLVYRVLYSN